MDKQKEVQRPLSKTAIVSCILSCLGIVLGPPSILGGIIAGHIARRRCRSHPHLRGRRLALTGLLVGYSYLIIIVGFVLFLAGIFEFPKSITDRGILVWEGCFPHDANTTSDRNDHQLLTINSANATLGTIESREQNLELIFRTPAGDEHMLWRYADYGCVSKVTFDETTMIVRVYYDHTLFREKFYVSELSLHNMSTTQYLSHFGDWLL